MLPFHVPGANGAAADVDLDQFHRRTPRCFAAFLSLSSLLAKATDGSSRIGRDVGHFALLHSRYWAANGMQRRSSLSHDDRRSSH
jgi:hypothetical protein